MRFNEIKWVKMLVVFAVLMGVLLVNGAITTPVEAGSAAQESTSNVYWWWGDPTSGASTLTRTSQDVSVTLDTAGLEEDYAYTMWWVIFNRPNKCSSPCGEDDFNDETIEAAQISVGWAASAVPEADGTAQFVGHLEKNDSIGFFLGSGLKNPRSAEIHLVVRSHGPYDPGEYGYSQLDSFEGGCVSGYDQPPTGSEDVPVGPGDCADEQFAIHQPPSQLRGK